MNILTRHANTIYLGVNPPMAKEKPAVFALCAFKLEDMEFSFESRGMEQPSPTSRKMEALSARMHQNAWEAMQDELDRSIKEGLI